ncbi:MAG: 30S ribosome-binding factor RbfA [Oscillospiraceae bacterium]|nr:30S ribosome-binding factor RbfA [Oscillospiraceae bacterium]
MPNFKSDRVAEDIRRELSAMLRELKDPRINSLLTVVRCNVTNDLSSCKAYISSLEGFEKTKEGCEGLKHASGLIRKEIANRLHLRKAPEFKFIADDGVEHSAHLQELMDEINKKG